MIPSDRCVEMIKRFEGLSLRLYNDVGGKPTIGYGHLIQHTEMLWCIDGISGQVAQHLLTLDLDRIGQKVTELTQGIPLRPQCFDALCCLAFNIGTEALGASTLLRDLRAGNVEGALASWLQWDHVKGVVVDGLRKRREAEVAMFREGLPKAA